MHGIFQLHAWHIPIALLHTFPSMRHFPWEAIGTRQMTSETRLLRLPITCNRLWSAGHKQTWQRPISAKVSEMQQGFSSAASQVLSCTFWHCPTSPERVHRTWHRAERFAVLKKKSLDATAKGVTWCDHCSLGKLKAVWRGKGWDCQWTMPKKEGRARALLLGVLFPNTFLYRKFGLTSARLMHLRNPAFSTDVCCLFLKPAPHLFHVCQQRCNYSYSHSRTHSIAAFDANMGNPCIPNFCLFLHLP